MSRSPMPSVKTRRPAPRLWREYERRKAEFLRDCAGAKPADYEAFIRTLGRKLGL